MIIPATRDLQMWRNADYLEVWTLATAAGPIDITGWAFAMQIRVQPGQPGAALISLATPTSGLSILSGPGGQLYVQIAGSALNGLPGPSNPLTNDVFYYDLTAAPGAGGHYIYLTGKVILAAGVTR